MNEAKIVALTQPVVEGVGDVGDFVAYAARVSNPSNQLNTGTSEKLLKYLARNAHWSPFEMISITMEIDDYPRHRSPNSTPSLILLPGVLSAIRGPHIRPRLRYK
jgi:thymidylate synthase ThyX